MNGKEIQDMLDRVKEITEDYQRRFLEQNKGTPFGYVDPPDPIFKLWFEQRASENPNWLLALAFIDDPDASKDVKRYMRITGVDNQGVIWREFAIHLALKFWEDAQIPPSTTAPQPVGVF